MDPTKLAGKIREQVDKENSARRKFSRRYSDLTKPDLYKFYNQNYVNDEIRRNNIKEYYPYQYTGHGDSYFVSKDMYNALIAICRCGRPKSEGHIIKCLQKVKNKYLENGNLWYGDGGGGGGGGSNNRNTSNAKYDSSTNCRSRNSSSSSGNDNISDYNRNDSNGSKKNGNTSSSSSSSKKPFFIGKVPETSGGMIGWVPHRYAIWERSTRYISPKYTMPGHKITDHPYNCIFIG